MSKRLCNECQKTLGNHEEFTVGPMLGSVCFSCGDTQWRNHSLVSDANALLAKANRFGGVDRFAEELKKAYDESPPDVKAKIERKVGHLLRIV